MEFNFDLNSVLGDGITVLDRTLTPHRNAQIRNGDIRRQLFEVIDKMGDASAEAQGLHGAITSGRKMELSDHTLYIMKDRPADSKPCVVGILKTGRKRLFVYDTQGQQHEMNPLCILDFYVHESRQRTGCGKRLFEFMLQKENIQPCHLAIDRPSMKFSSFLQKHYKLKNKIPQMNNFVVYDGFLNQNDCYVNRRRGGHRFSNGYLTNDKNLEQNNSNIENNRNHFYSYGGSRPPSGKQMWPTKNANNQPHTESNHTNVSNQININNRPPSGRNRGQGQMGSRPNSGKRPSSGRHQQEQKLIEQNIQAIKDLNIPPRTNSAESGDLANKPDIINDRLLGARDNSYSRHTITRRTPSPKTFTRPNSQHNNEQYGKNIGLNLHQEYQGLGGHLRTNPLIGQKIETTLPRIGTTSAPIRRQPYWQTQQEDNTWTVGNVLRKQQYLNSKFW